MDLISINLLIILNFHLSIIINIIIIIIIIKFRLAINYFKIKIIIINFKIIIIKIVNELQYSPKNYFILQEIISFFLMNFLLQISFSIEN